MMKIGLDIMGGDFAPAEAVAGVRRFFDQTSRTDVHVVLIGDEQVAAPYIKELEALHANKYTVVHTDQVIGMHEHPTKALKEKPQSSIGIGFHLLKEGKVDAFMSAGNTGAMMVGSMYSVKNIEGVLRPTIASPIPREDGNYNLLLDVGINADCKPENLVQFAQLGSLYLKHVEGTENPRVGLLNLGEEEGKGNLLTQATFPLLKNCETINFLGNIEGRDVFYNKADVTVCEGFVGNVLLKSAESIFNLFAEKRNVKDPFLEKFNFEVYGGTPILGINSPVIIGHGISHSLAFMNMIEVAAKIVESDLINEFKKAFKTPVSQDI